MAKKTAPAKATPTPRSSNEAAAIASRENAALRVGTRVKVTATRLGYYDDVRRRIGDVFVYTIGPNEKALPSWMEPVDPTVPLRTTSAPEALKQHHDELLSARYVPQGSQIPDDDDTNPLKA